MACKTTILCSQTMFPVDVKNMQLFRSWRIRKQEIVLRECSYSIVVMLTSNILLYATHLVRRKMNYSFHHGFEFYYQPSGSGRYVFGQVFFLNVTHLSTPKLSSGIDLHTFAICNTVHKTRAKCGLTSG